eukprot:2074867-Pleurochrysis_carterae.AAC.1
MHCALPRRYTRRMRPMRRTCRARPPFVRTSRHCAVAAAAPSSCSRASAWPAKRGMRWRRWWRARCRRACRLHRWRGQRANVAAARTRQGRARSASTRRARAAAATSAATAAATAAATRAATRAACGRAQSRRALGAHRTQGGQPETAA